MGNICFLTLHSAPLWVCLCLSSAAVVATPDSLWGMNLKDYALTKAMLVTCGIILLQCPIEICCVKNRDAAGDIPTNKRKVRGGRNMFSNGGGCGRADGGWRQFWHGSDLLLCCSVMCASREMCERDLLLTSFLLTILGPIMITC